MHLLSLCTLLHACSSVLPVFAFSTTLNADPCPPSPCPVPMQTITLTPRTSPPAEAPPRPAIGALADDTSGQVKVASNFFASQALKTLPRQQPQPQSRPRNAVLARMQQVCDGSTHL